MGKVGRWCGAPPRSRGVRAARGSLQDRPKSKRQGAAGGADDFSKFGAGSTTDGKDARRDHTLKQGNVLSAPQSFPILWWLGVVIVSLSDISGSPERRWK